MKIDQLASCPFCGKKPVRHGSLSGAGFVGSDDENQVFLVACTTKACPPSQVFLPDLVWNRCSVKQGELMTKIFESMIAQNLPGVEARKKQYKLYVMSH